MVGRTFSTRLKRFKTGCSDGRIWFLETFGERAHSGVPWDELVARLVRSDIAHTAYADWIVESLEDRLPREIVLAERDRLLAKKSALKPRSRDELMKHGMSNHGIYCLYIDEHPRMIADGVRRYQKYIDEYWEKRRK